MKSKKQSRPSPRADARGFAVVLEDLRAKFDVFGEALQGLRRETYGMRDDLRSEMHGIRDELRSEMRAMRDDLRSEMGEMRDEVRSEMREMRTDISLLKAAVLDLSKRVP